MRVDAGPELDLLDLDGLLLLAGLGRLFLRLKLELAVVQNLADGRRVVGGNFDQIEPGLSGQGDRVVDRCYASVGSLVVDQLNLADADLVIHARSIFLDRLSGSHRTANGCRLLSSENNRRRGEPGARAGLRETELKSMTGRALPVPRRRRLPRKSTARGR